MPSCKFCGATEKLTGEHVFPDWLRKAVGDGGAHFFRRKEDGTVEQWQTIAYSTTVKDVCESCNTGWMSHIESAAAPVLTPMIIDGNAVTLDEPRLQAIANWIALRSLVIPLASGPAEIPDGLYKAMFQTHSIMDNSAAWLGLLEGTDARTAFFLGATLDIDGTDPDHPDGYFATMAVGKFVSRFFVLSPGRGQLGAVTNDPFDGFLVHIWPGVNKADWPPQALDVGAYTGLTQTIPKATAILT